DLQTVDDVGHTLGVARKLHRASLFVGRANLACERHDAILRIDVDLRRPDLVIANEAALDAGGDPRVRLGTAHSEQGNTAHTEQPPETHSSPPAGSRAECRPLRLPNDTLENRQNALIHEPARIR